MNTPSRYSPDSQHRTYGIKNWLISKGFCLWEDSENMIDGEQYKELLKEFCLHHKPDFDLSKVKNLGTYEQYVTNHFQEFCHFCINIYYKKIKDQP
jgi:hypothetical protein